MKEKSNQLITALYCRLSVEDERSGESLSIENQRKMLTEYAQQHGFTNCRFYVDDGYSGTDQSRPAYRQMLHDIERELIGCVVVKDQSRLGRDHLETDRLMELFFPSYDVRFIAITDGVDSAKGGNDMSTLRNYFNDFYARDTSKKIRAVQRAKGERGERVGSKIAYGYMKSPDDPKQIVPDPETAPIVKQIFELYASGIGIPTICVTLERQNIWNPSVYGFKMHGRRSKGLNLDRPYHWGQTSVRRILSNQIYCGDTVNFKTYSKNNKLKKRLQNAPENVLIFPDTHEPIISRRLFDLVQKHFEGRKRPDKSGEMDKYAGYLYCAECGARLYLQRSRKKDPKSNNFMCGGYQKRTTDCTSHYIRECVLDEIVLGQLREITAYARDHAEEFYEMAVQNGEAEAKKATAAAEQRKSQLSARIAEIDSIIRTLYEDRVTERITPERYDIMAAGYEDEQARLKVECQTLTEQLAKQDLREQYVREFMEKAQSYIEMPILTPELLRTFVRKIEVHEKPKKYSRTVGNTVVIHYTFQMPQDRIVRTEESAETMAVSAG